MQGRHAEKPSKATGFYYYSYNCKSHSKCFLERGWQAMPEGYKESLAGVFQHICPANNSNLMQRVGLP